MSETSDLGVQAAADAIADRLASPADVRGLELIQGWFPQSLAYGAAGVALLHVERARSGIASWKRAHDWLACAAEAPAVGGVDGHLYYGAPALAFALNAAAADRPERYARALDTLDRHIENMTRHRLERAHLRMDRGQLPALAEFDTIRGLSGLGALLLRREGQVDTTRAILSYLVRLTEPIESSGELLPGWWCDLAPSGKPSPEFPQGHANTGVAHGIGGPLALLSIAARRGVTVDGQAEAISRICAWLDRWRQDGPAGPWWPYWITREQLRSGDAGNGPSRPSWCYGTAGIARALQLAGIATGNTERQQMAESAMAHAMTDPEQLQAIGDHSICHGFAGLAHITRSMAADAINLVLAEHLPRLLARTTHVESDALATSLLRPPNGPGDIGLLEGAAGVALALHATQTGTPPVSGWDTCFLIN
ncbi:lanthionine synthetase C family protein [Streptomyces lydicus]|uniref:lanthionine synthetase C family protein n=1 Tax=Streptomyces lydicus TaxID=47763 RepID=UPI0034154C2D